MKKNKKDVYKKLLRNLIKTKSISKSTKNILSEKGGRMICKRLETFGYISFDYMNKRTLSVDVTEKGIDLLNKLNDFKFEFKEMEVFK